jgi:hypothetical protein
MNTHIAPSGLKTWHVFAFLIATAVACYYAGKLILFVAAIVCIVRGWWWLSLRFPKTMIFVNFVLSAMLGGRRQRW